MNILKLASIVIGIVWIFDIITQLFVCIIALKHQNSNKFVIFFQYLFYSIPPVIWFKTPRYIKSAFFEGGWNRVAIWVKIHMVCNTIVALGSFFLVIALVFMLIK